MNASQYSLSFLDHSNELSNVQVYIPKVTAANFAAILDEGIPAALAAALKAVSIGTPVREAVTLDVVTAAMTPPVSPYAQRELALRVGYQDDVTTKRYEITIPCADWNSLGQAGTDAVDPTEAEWTALVVALEADAVSVDGNPITVISGRLVGRAS